MDGGKSAVQHRTGVMQATSVVTKAQYERGNSAVQEWVSGELRQQLVEHLTTVLDDERRYVVQLLPLKQEERDALNGLIVFRQSCIVALADYAAVDVGETVFLPYAGEPPAGHVVTVGDGRSFSAMWAGGELYWQRIA